MSSSRRKGYPSFTFMKIHPSKALQDYRKAMDINAQLIVCPTSLHWLIPMMAGMLDISDFDSTAPEIIRSEEILTIAVACFLSTTPSSTVQRTGQYLLTMFEPTSSVLVGTISHYNEVGELVSRWALELSAYTIEFRGTH